MPFSDWSLNQQNLIKFVLVNASNVEVPGLADTFTLEISKGGFPVAAFTPGLGLKGEMSDGWYYYQSVLAEANTVGEVAIKVTGPGLIQQNLIYTVARKAVQAIAYTYTVLHSVTLLPLVGARVWFTTDALGNNPVFVGYSDTFGVVRDTNGDLPILDIGTYYVWKYHPAFSDDNNPDTEDVSP